MNKTYIYPAWIVSTLASGGSLFFSYFMKFPPCDLCWYQRIFMFPVVIILWLGIYREDEQALRYAWPLTTIGLAISVYHNLLYYKWIEAELIPCTSGVSCTEKQLELFGFITIPLMSLVAFTFIFALLSLGLKSLRSSHGK